MQNWRPWRYAKLLLLTVLFVIAGAGTAFAQTSTSNNYQLTETQFGATQESCSGQYCAQATIGDISNGNAMTSSSATFEDIVDNEPLLDVIIGSSASNLGVLSTETTATKTTTVQVRTYLTGGYTLQIIGGAPKFGEHVLKTPTTPTASKPGTEQFALNAVANTTPNVGANPVQVPDGQGAFGVVEDDYFTPNRFKYVSEEVVARGVTDSGRTDYTISMIINISSATPAGHYTGDFAAVVIPAF